MKRTKRCGAVSILSAWVALTLIVLSGCDGKSALDVINCERINGTIYSSDRLLERGRSGDGVNYGYWRVRFEDGQLFTEQSDVNMQGTYSCQNDLITASFGKQELPLEFSYNFQTLDFNPFGGEPIAYSKDQPVLQLSECEQVKGNRYAPKSFIDAGENPASTSKYFDFSSGQSVSFMFDTRTELQGIYVCDTGNLHVHRNTEDTNPYVFTVTKEGDHIEMHTGDTEREEYIRVDEPDFCPAVYLPVCAEVKKDIQCVTTPCPNTFYQTFGNQCEANQPNVKIAFEGECGKLEGQPVEESRCEEPLTLCGGVTRVEACTSLPCPSVVYQTVEDFCPETDRPNFYVLGEQACDEGQEGQEVDKLALICPTVVIPACAKQKTETVCVTEPCPTHEYKTYSLDCVAKADRAAVVYSETECGELEGQLAFDQPPVKIVTELPEPLEETSVRDISIANDILSLSLAFSGCDEQHFELFIEDAFLESNPVQVRTVLQAQVSQLCEAVISQDYAYDLLPLKAQYQKLYGKGAGEIILRGLGTYRF